MSYHSVDMYRPGGRRNSDRNPEINIIPPVEASKLDGVSFPSDARVVNEGGKVGRIVLSRGTDVTEHNNLIRAVRSSIGSGTMSSDHIYTHLRPR